MGYTHYFHQQRAATPEQWKAICNDFKKLQVAALVTTGFPIQREEDNSAQPLINEHEIAFNGAGDDAHETMVLEQAGTGAAFQFCKTARKPYDRAVVALLILAHHHAPGVWAISSDGDAEDWQPTLNWMNLLGMGHFVLPPGVR